jgi:hypothetical protein
MIEAGCNLKADPITISHASLARYGDSGFMSTCPVCKEGLLAVQRNEKTFRLINCDNCVLCGQFFFYTDTRINGEPVDDVRPSVPDAKRTPRGRTMDLE